MSARVKDITKNKVDAARHFAFAAMTKAKEDPANGEPTIDEAAQEAHADNQRVKLSSRRTAKRTRHREGGGGEE